MDVFTTVVVGADDSSTARQAVAAAVQIAKMSGGRLHIVTAYDPKSVHIDDLPAEFRLTAVHPADALLHSLSEIARREGIEPEVHPAAAAPVDAVVTVAEQCGADLIVVGNKGMKGARRVLGSVPNSIAHEANCSVLIVDTVGGGS
jgi:nucleotide-binding universal stress UspA family protein